MEAYSNLRKAILNRSDDIENIKTDLKYLDNQMDKFRQYFNAVYEQVVGEQSLLEFKEAGLMKDKEFEVAVDDLAENEKLAYSLAVEASVKLNRYCDAYGLNHFAPEVTGERGAYAAKQADIASFTAKYMYEAYQKGTGIELDNVTLDTVIAIADSEDRTLDMAYEKAEKLINREVSPLAYTKADLDTRAAAEAQIDEITQAENQAEKPAKQFMAIYNALGSEDQSVECFDTLDEAKTFLNSLPDNYEGYVSLDDEAADFDLDDELEEDNMDIAE